MSKIKVTTISDPDNDNTALTVDNQGNVTFATEVGIGSNWTVKDDGSGNLVFYTSGVAKMKLDASGNLTVTGDVTAYGTI